MQVKGLFSENPEIAQNCFAAKLPPFEKLCRH
jgi:hypothetical protein